LPARPSTLMPPRTKRMTAARASSTAKELPKRRVRGSEDLPS
jgi:hypothetical protein